MATDCEIAKERKLEQMILSYGFWGRYANNPKSAEQVCDKLRDLQSRVVSDQMSAVAPLYDDMEECFRKVFECYEQPAEQAKDTVMSFDFFI